ncbi:MAG: hypothetical protein GY859_44400 [Desulfobacterales bacterium]|nr:hypothetical protein [Desulfobacterales bacterium]
MKKFALCRRLGATSIRVARDAAERDAEEWKRVERAVEAIFDEALSMDGTLSGEHGTGIAKSHFLEKETGPAAIVFSRRIKSALDPNNILNPEKIIGGGS